MWISYGSFAHSPHAVLTRTSVDTLPPTCATHHAGGLDRHPADELADCGARRCAHFCETSNTIEVFAEAARTYGHRLVERTDAAHAISARIQMIFSRNGDSVAAGSRRFASCRRPTTMAEYLRTQRHGTVSTTCCTRPAILYAQRFRGCRIVELSPPYGASARPGRLS